MTDRLMVVRMVDKSVSVQGVVDQRKRDVEKKGIEIYKSKGGGIWV